MILFLGEIQPTQRMAFGAMAEVDQDMFSDEQAEDDYSDYPEYMRPIDGEWC